MDEPGEPRGARVAYSDQWQWPTWRDLLDAFYQIGKDPSLQDTSWQDVPRPDDVAAGLEGHSVEFQQAEIIL